MAKPNPAAELAARYIARLEELRSSGAGYPIRLDELLAGVAADTPPDLQAKALKHAAFRSRTLLGQAKRADAPVALVEDRDLLAASSALFEFACRCSPSSGPPWNVAELKKLLPKPLQAGFEQACIERRSRGDTSLALTLEEWQVRRLLNRLQAASPAGDSVASALSVASPTLRSIAEQSGFNSVKDAAKLKKLVASAAFTAVAVVLLDKTLDTPIAPADRVEILLRPEFALPTLLAAARTDKKRILPLKDLLKKASPRLRTPIQDSVTRSLASGESLGPVGAIQEGKEFRFFLLSDLEPHELRRKLLAGSASPSASAAPIGIAGVGAAAGRAAIGGGAIPASHATSPDRGDFAAQFEAAFSRLDAAAGGHNQVSLLPLRAALERWTREEFDTELQQLRLTGRFVLSGLQNRGGMSPEEQAAGIREAGLLRVYVSRRR